MPKQFFCPHCEHCCRLQEAAKPFVPKMKSFPEFPSLPAANLLSVYQKLNPASFSRLRRTCRRMDEYAEENRSFIGVKVNEIKMVPKEWRRGSHLKSVGYC